MDIYNTRRMSDVKSKKVGDKMTILQKGPYTRKEYKEYRDELDKQIGELDSNIEDREPLSIVFSIPTAICLAFLLMKSVIVSDSFRFGFSIGPSTTLTNSINISIATIIINTVCVGLYYLLCVNPYKNQLKQLKNEKAELVDYYRTSLVDVPLDDYIEHISVVGNQVIIPSLDTIDESYLYRRYNRSISDGYHKTSHTYELCPDKLKGSLTNIPITKDEYTKLRQKSKCSPRSTKQTTVTNKRLVKMANTTEVTIEHSVTTKDGTRTETYKYTL